MRNPDEYHKQLLTRQPYCDPLWYHIQHHSHLKHGEYDTLYGYCKNDWGHVHEHLNLLKHVDYYDFDLFSSYHATEIQTCKNILQSLKKFSSSNLPVLTHPKRIVCFQIDAVHENGILPILQPLSEFTWQISFLKHTLIVLKSYGLKSTILIVWCSTVTLHPAGTTVVMLYCPLPPLTLALYEWFSIWISYICRLMDCARKHSALSVLGQASNGEKILSPPLQSDVCTPSYLFCFLKMLTMTSVFENKRSSMFPQVLCLHKLLSLTNLLLSKRQRTQYTSRDSHSESCPLMIGTKARGQANATRKQKEIKNDFTSLPIKYFFILGFFFFKKVIEIASRASI